MATVADMKANLHSTLRGERNKSSDYLVGWYQKACEHADETALTIVIGEESRHGGRIDVVRELIDGRANTYRHHFGDATKWREYVAKVQAAADVFAEKS